MLCVLDILAGIPGLGPDDPVWKLAAVLVYLSSLVIVPSLDAATDGAVERGLAVAETRLLVVTVLAMLALAGYNVAYRNFLVPARNALQTSFKPPPAAASAEPGPESSAGATESEGEASRSGFEGGFGGEGTNSGTTDSEGEADESGFEGGFGGDGSNSGTSDSESGNDESGFEGGFGGGGNGGESTDGETGFEGGFGGAGGETSDESTDSQAGASTDTKGGFEGGFDGGKSREGTPPDDRAARTKSAQSSPAAPAPVFVRSTATSLAAVIAAVKLSWIDVLLRHLVLVVGFLGGLLAVRRREHITVDAVGQLFEGRTKEWVDAGTSAVAAVICTLLVLAGLELVELSLKWPSEVLPGIDQWALQLMFPVGFGLMGVHFAVRAWHSSLRARGDERPVGVDDDRPEGGRP